MPREPQKHAGWHHTCPRPPRPVFPQPRRLPERKRPMTIAAGFVCSDGLIFASDTLYAGVKREYGRKFWIIDRSDVVVVFGGAGTAPGLKRTRDLLLQSIQSGMTREEVVLAIEAALHYVGGVLKPTDERTEALIGIRVGARCWLYENQGGGAALTVIDGRSQCVGYGNTLGRYFTDTLFTSNMPMRWAEVVAAHLIKHVKIHSSVWCGGRTHLFELPAEGRCRHIKNKQQVEELERYLAQVDAAMQIVLPGAGGVSDHTLEQRLTKLTDVIRDLSRSQFVALTSASVIVSSGHYAAMTSQPPGNPTAFLTNHQPAKPIEPEASQGEEERPAPKDPNSDR